MSPHTFLEEKKLAYAKQLLMGGASVTDACFGAGFSDNSHFISVFKRKFGETPYKYKSK
jgi:AraC-like DNA-binding protein